MSVKPQWMAVGAVAGLLLVMLLSNRQPTTPEGLPVIDTLQGYKDAILQANDLTKDLFAKVDRGEELNDQEKAQLIEAGKVIDNADHYRPQTVTYLGAGKAYQFAGQLDLAQERYEQCLANVPSQKADPNAVTTGYEAHYRLSQIAFAKGDFAGALDQVNKAVQGEPTSTPYLCQQASSLIQLKRYGEAKKVIHEALALDPGNTTALGLQKLLAGQ